MQPCNGYIDSKEYTDVKIEAILKDFQYSNLLKPCID